MIKAKDILDEKDPILRTISKPVIFPLLAKEKKLINDMLDLLEDSQIPEKSEKYGLRPGMGLAAIQLGLAKRFFVISWETTKEDDEKQSFERYAFVNPKIISTSEEMIAAEMGEGCLSVNREVDGIVPRHARITVEAFNEDGKPFTIRLREEMSIAVQHEIDHLNGILFYDHIDKKNPFKNKEKMRML